MTRNVKKANNNHNKRKGVDDKKRSSARRRQTARLTLEQSHARIKELTTALGVARDAMQRLVDEDFSGSITIISDRVAYNRLMSKVEAALREVEMVATD